MIMPCMNSTSACERGGSVAFIDGGSVLVGLPGAPGCTTAGLAESFCCASTAKDKTPAKPRSARRRRTGAVTFTTGSQDRTRTPAIAMLAPNTQRDFEDGKWALKRTFPAMSLLELNALCGILCLNFGEATSSMTWRNTSAKRALLLTGDGLKFRIGERTNLRIPREHSRTCVPAQNGVIVSMRPEGFGSLVVIHRLAQGMIGIGVAGGPILAEMRMGLAFPDETGVVGTLVLTFDAGEQLFRRFHRSAVVKLIGARKQERNERLLMGRQNRQDVQANAFGQVRFVQKPVTFGLLQSLGNGIGRDGF